MNTSQGQYVLPLPFIGMSKYPYDENEHYPVDKKHQQFQVRQVNGPHDIGAYEYVDLSTEVRVNKTLSREIIIYPLPAQNFLHLRNIEVYSNLKIVSPKGEVLYHE